MPRRLRQSNPAPSERKPRLRLVIDDDTPLCPFCGQVLVLEVDGVHCGACAITWWPQ
jgi:ribosomal protein S27AE